MKLKKLLALLLVVSLLSSLFVGCSGGTDSTGNSSDSSVSEDAETEKKGTEDNSQVSEPEAVTFGSGEWRTYDTPITVKMGVAKDINANEYVAMADVGEPYDNNRWIQLFRDRAGIEVEYDLIVPTEEDYNQQLILAMTLNELPDVFKVYDMNIYHQLIEAGQVADITDVYEREANPILKGIIEGEGENFIDNYKVDGKLYGVPGKMPSTNGFSYLWIRKDWLDKLGMEIPTTVQEVEELAIAFKEQDPDGNGIDDTIGISTDQHYVTFGSMGIFWAFGGQISQDKYWSTLDDGSLGYSAVQPEMKGGLKWMQSLYQRDILNQEWFTQGFWEIAPMIADNKLGLFYGTHWYSGQMNSVKEEIPEAEWIPILAPGQDGSPATAYANIESQGIECVRADYEHPEAMISMMNVYAESMFGENNEFGKYFSNEQAGNLWQTGPFYFLSGDVDLVPHRQMAEAHAAGTLDTLDGVGGDYWKQIEGGDLSYELMFGPVGSCFELVDDNYPDLFVWNSYQGAPTPTQSDRWASMQEIIDTSYIEMIIGDEDIDVAFDRMVEEWNAAGGTEVTKEINEAAMK